MTRELNLAQLALLLLLGAAAPAPAAVQEEVPERERSLVVYGDDPCPRSEDPDEIVVCARRPEEERYRIPEPLRRERQRTQASWTSQAAALDEAQRETRPDGCSVVGSYGQSGCTQEMLRRWRAEQRAQRRRR